MQSTTSPPLPSTLALLHLLPLTSHTSTGSSRFSVSSILLLLPPSLPLPISFSPCPPPPCSPAAHPLPTCCPPAAHRLKSLLFSAAPTADSRASPPPRIAAAAAGDGDDDDDDDGCVDTASIAERGEGEDEEMGGVEDDSADPADHVYVLCGLRCLCTCGLSVRSNTRCAPPTPPAVYCASSSLRRSVRGDAAVAAAAVCATALSPGYSRVWTDRITILRNDSSTTLCFDCVFHLLSNEYVCVGCVCVLSQIWLRSGMCEGVWFWRRKHNHTNKHTHTHTHTHKHTQTHTHARTHNHTNEHKHTHTHSPVSDNLLVARLDNVQEDEEETSHLAVAQLNVRDGGLEHMGGGGSMMARAGGG